MRIEALRGRNLYQMLAIPMGALALSGCGPNYSGAGNEFVVYGKVTDPGKHSLKAEIHAIEGAQGEAEEWFKLGNVHQLHDNCDCQGLWNSNKTLGIVYDRRGYEIEPSDVAIGACVRFEGRIRADSEGKYSDNRPVYETAQVEQCKP